jgi:hypothetical protein
VYIAHGQRVRHGAAQVESVQLAALDDTAGATVRAAAAGPLLLTAHGAAATALPAAGHATVRACRRA